MLSAIPADNRKTQNTVLSAIQADLPEISIGFVWLFFHQTISVQIYIFSSGSVEKWMQSLPRLLTQGRPIQTSSERGYKVMLEVIKEVASQGHTVLLDALQKHSGNILGSRNIYLPR